jgi:rfaE bifunctional protein nucleotidyltransferase chain/domain
MLSSQRLSVRGDAPTIVLAHGCFDLLHLGHIRHLQEAKKLGDKLVVSVTADKFVNKGAWRPAFNEHERAEALRALSFVDEVHINDAPNAVAIIEAVRPHIYVKGQDYAGSASERNLAQEIAAVVRMGGEFATTSAEKWSSSHLLNSARFGPVLTAYLKQARDQGFLGKIHAAFARLKKLNVVFIGETIIDEYRYVAPLGKPSKEFVLAVAEQSREEFAGGVVAAAAHLAPFCNVEVVSQSIGEMRKIRYVGADFSQKIFEVYSCAALSPNIDERRLFNQRASTAVGAADAVIVMDFGHGLIDAETRVIAECGRFVAVNAQTNAGNNGFNPITRYNDIDYVCIDLPEARLAAQEQNGEPEALCEFLGRKMKAANIAITHGRHGAYCGPAFKQVPAFVTKPVDTIGAGDAFLAISGALLAAGLELEPAVFVGNVAGALKTEILGHRESVDPLVLIQTVAGLLA